MDVFSGKGLTCIRSERIVFAGFNFSVKAGDALVLSGPNGSGKSSLLRLMAGISRPAAGQITWRGKSITEDPEHFFSDMHYVGHRDAVKQALSVRENLIFHSALRSVTSNIDNALDLTGLAALANVPARMLSAGQTRRLALARILASPAPLWLLDEPTVALDTVSVERLRAAIASHREGGGIVIASTNVPLNIEDGASVDISTFARENATLWSSGIATELATAERI